MYLKSDRWDKYLLMGFWPPITAHRTVIQFFSPGGGLCKKIATN